MSDSYFNSTYPDATASPGLWTVVGAASHHAAVGDNTDATYIQQGPGVGVGGQAIFGFGPSTVLPGNSRFAFLQVSYRASMAPPLSGPLRFDLLLPGVGSVTAITSPIVPSTPWDLGVRFYSRPGGGPWMTEDIDRVLLYVLGAKTATTKIYKLSLDVYVNYPPAAVPIGPGTVLDTSFPPLSFSYIDTEHDAQEMVEGKVFAGGAGVANPTTETARLIGETGQVFTSATSINGNHGLGLSNGTYRWAVRARDVGAPSGLWGYWGQSTFTVSVPSPEAPGVVVTPDPANARYVLALSDAGGTYPPEHYWVERSDDNGLTWALVRGMRSVPSTGLTTTVYDYWAPRMARTSTSTVVGEVGYNAPISYNADVGYDGSSVIVSGTPNVVRYRVRATRSYLGHEVISDWTTVTPASLVGNATTWLKHPYDASRSMMISHMADWESVSEEQMVALRASGRADWVVFGDVPSLERGDLDIVFPGDAAWANFERLRAPAYPLTATPLLLQSCFGDTVLEQMWVRLGANRTLARVTHTGQNIKQYRRTKVGFVQTLTPTEA